MDILTLSALKDYFVEVDVVMDANTPLWLAHDLSQQLQDKIEVLPNVERAFVHVDHETTHVPVSYHSFISLSCSLVV
jgi:divalent metal cation (Fe/Co/Zn/Cd) transporter